MLKIFSIAGMAGTAAALPDSLNLFTAQDEQTLVDFVNFAPNVLWRAEVGALKSRSLRTLTGVKETSHEAVLKLPRHVSSIRDEDVPDTFDSATNWPKCAKVIGDIRDQSMCGCCWAFAGAEAASDRLCIATNGTVAVPLSAQDVCFCASEDGCDGGQIDTPWQYIADSGAVTGGQFEGTYPVGDNKGLCADFSLPHCHHHGPQGNDPYPAEGTPGCEQQSSAQCPRKCDANATAPHNDFAKDKWSFSGQVQSASGESGIQKAIMEGGPVETAFTVYSDFANYASGIYHHVSGGVEGGHAVRIVGWGVENGNKFWKVANSWNPYWGEQGYFRIKRGGNECGIENGVTFSGADAKWSQGSSPAPGPSPGPSPGPGPAPGPQDCVENNDKKSCSNESGCYWCAFAGEGFCFSQPCPGQ